MSSLTLLSPTPISDHSAKDSAHVDEVFAVPNFEKQVLLSPNDPDIYIYLTKAHGLLKVTAILVLAFGGNDLPLLTLAVPTVYVLWARHHSSFPYVLHP